MLEIEEKGTKFAEGIEIDEQRNVAVFRVPAHNDVLGADFYNDFQMVCVWNFSLTFRYRVAATRRQNKSRWGNENLTSKHCVSVLTLNFTPLRKRWFS